MHTHSTRNILPTSSTNCWLSQSPLCPLLWNHKWTTIKGLGLSFSEKATQDNIFFFIFNWSMVDLPCLLVLGVQHSDSEFLQIISHYRLLQDIGVYLKKTDFFFWSKFSFFRKEGCCAFFLTRTQGEEQIGKWRLEPNLRMLQSRQCKISLRKGVIWYLMYALRPVSPLVLYSGPA